MRETPAWTALSNVTTIAVANGTEDESLIVDIYPTIPFNLYAYLGNNGENYTSFNQAAGPVQVSDDYFTETVSFF